MWFVIDTDEWEELGKIVPLREFCIKQNVSIPEELDEVKSYQAWNVAQSNPCFEIWLYYHLYDHKPNPADVVSHASFKEYVNNTISGGFHFEKDPVRLEDAITNTEKNNSYDKNGKLKVYSSEMHLLGREIYGFVKSDLKKLRNKLG